LFSLAAPVCLLWVTVTAAGCRGETKAAANPVPVWLTLDPATNKVIADPSSVPLHYNHHDLALWKIKPATTAFDFNIEFKPPSNIPKPACSGTGMGHNCRSIVVTMENVGTHQYKIIVHTSGGDVITDPEVTVDP
jgi:hypothetical protein